MAKLACVFPGQGSQSTGMLKELAVSYPVVLDTFQQASTILDYDLWTVVQDDTSDTLNQTQVTQPALLASSVAVWRVLQQEVSMSVAMMAGHSLGEYSALVCAGVLDFSDAIGLVEARGRFMQDAVPAGTGAMYAIIGLDDQNIIDICHEQSMQTGEIVSAVNFNSPGQVVIAGEKAAVEAAGAACKAAGAKRALPLPVSVPSHCELMRPAADKLAERLASVGMSTPTISVVNNVDVSTEHDGESIKAALIRQLYCPVRWTETVQLLSAQGVTKILELGPGKVLSGLIKRIDKSIATDSINTPEAIQNLTSEA